MNDVKITEHEGSIRIVSNHGNRTAASEIPPATATALEAHYRAKFAAEQPATPTPSIEQIAQQLYRLDYPGLEPFAHHSASDYLRKAAVVRAMFVSPVSEQPTPERFTVREQEKCMCGMRVFEVDDAQEGSTVRVHVGALNPYDKAHDAVRAILHKEREQPTPLDPEPVVYVRRDGSLSPNRSAVLGLIDAFPDMYRFKPGPEFEQDRARYEGGN